MTQKELQEWFEELEKLIEKHPRQWNTFKLTSRHKENVSCISCIYGSQSEEQLNENHRFSKIGRASCRERVCLYV